MSPAADNKPAPAEESAFSSWRQALLRSLCSIRILAAVLCAAFIISTAICLLVTTFSFSMSAAQDIAERHAVAIATKAKNDVEGLLNKPLASVSSWQYTYSRGNKPLPRDSTVANWYEDYWQQFTEAMKATDFSYQFAVFGFDDGNYAGCKNLVGENFMCRLFNRPSNFTGQSDLLEYSYYRSNYSVYHIGSGKITYDPRTRGWYNMVNHTPFAMKWSSVYLSAMPTLPIIDVNAAMYNSSGALLGVISMTFELGLLSDFLADLVTTENTVSVLIDNEDLLLASSYSDPYLTSKTIPKPYTGTVPSNCLVSDSANDASSNIMLCRAPVASYSYAPLRQLAQDRPALVKNGQSGALRLELADKDYFVSVVPVVTAQATGMNWRFALFVPQNDIVGGIVRGRDIAIYVSIAIIVVAVGLCFIILTLLLSPLRAVTDQVSRVAKLDMSDQKNSKSVIGEIYNLQNSMDQLSNAMVSFTRYIPKEVVRDMLDAGQGLAELGMEPVHLCVFFSDIVQFTSICESIAPEDLSTLLNVYFSRCVAVLVRHNATVDKFIGDAIMAFWGAPIPNEHAEVWACLASLHIQSEIDRYVQPEFAKLGQEVRTRTGIHSGTALVGNIGSADRIAYTALGDTVNVAARLEGCNKLYGSAIMISSATREFISDKNFLVRYLGKIKVIGREAPLPIYEVHCVLSDVMEGDPTVTIADDFEGHQAVIKAPAKQLKARSRKSSLTTNKTGGSYSHTAYTNVDLAANRKRRGAFATVEEALAKVYQMQRPLSSLERSAIRTFHDAMTLYQQARLPEALLGFNTCKEILATIAPTHSTYHATETSHGSEDEVRALYSPKNTMSSATQSYRPIVCPKLVARMINQSSQAEWSETLQQLDK